MRILNLVVIIFLFNSFAQAKESVFELRSKEEIQFVSKEEVPLIGMMKIDDFRGIVFRLEQASHDLKAVDFYDFKSQNTSQINPSNCEQIVTKIYGSFAGTTYSLRREPLLSTRSMGSVCIMQVADSEKEAKIKERVHFIFSLKARVYAMVFKFAQPSSASDRQSMIDFVTSLK